MDAPFFDNLPSEIIIDILSRLPVRIVVACKLVHKLWRDLIQTREFADSHLHKSTPGLVTCSGLNFLEIFEIVDKIDIDRHELRYIPVTKFDCDEIDASFTLLQGSVNGFLLLLEPVRHTPYICNPVTREYIQLPCERHTCLSRPLATYGFGVTKATGQYKVVRIIHEYARDLDTHKPLRIANCACDVYTLGTASWRSIGNAPLLGNDGYSIPQFVNGRLHWSVTDFKGSNMISCFDFETEIYSAFSPPLCLVTKHRCLAGVLATLGDCLCFCESSNYEIVIWLMKEYGNERSWTKEFVISKPSTLVDDICTGIVYPMKIFANCDILMAWYNTCMFYYSNQTKTTETIDMLGPHEDYKPFKAMLHCSSFFSLKSYFPLENISLF